MAIVVDTSVVLAVAANEPTKPALIRATVGEELISPGSLAWEIGNALSAMLKRRRITVDEARAVITEYRRIPVRVIDVPVEECVRLAAKLGIYAYDAYMIQCAIVSGDPLLTLDVPLSEAARRAGVRTVEISP